MRPKYSKSREKLLDELEKSWLNRQRYIQARLYTIMNDSIISQIETFNDAVIVSNKNRRLIAEVDDVYKAFQLNQIKDLFNYFIDGSKDVFALNEKYYNSIKATSQNTFDTIKRDVYNRIGYDVKKESFLRGGQLDLIARDTGPAQTIKQQINKYMLNGADSTTLNLGMQTTIKGGDSAGVLERYLGQTMPDPYTQFDRETGTVASENLELNFAIYQGGIIRDSREFCIVRDNQVFSREEIAKFGTPEDSYGGYTNKSEGKFRGKCPSVGYNPFRNLGGCNCRHVLDWISDELAFEIRPELRQEPEESS